MIVESYKDKYVFHIVKYIRFIRTVRWQDYVFWVANEFAHSTQKTLSQSALFQNDVTKSL